MAQDDLCEICEIETGDNSEMSVVARFLPSMIKTSEKRGDGMWEFWKNVNNITVHTRCYENYMNVTNNVAAEKRKLPESVRNLVPDKKKHRISAVVPVKLDTNCIFCGQLCDEVVERKRCSSRRRAIVTISQDSSLKDDIQNSINLIDDDWATVVHERIKDKDSLCGLKYHSPCKSKFLYQRKEANKQNDRGRRAVREFAEAMQIVYNLIDNSEECQYSLEDLKEMTACDMTTYYLKEQLEKKYGDDVIFSSFDNQKTIVTLKRYEDQILSKYYESENPESEADRHIVKNAAQIICEDIQSTLFDSSTYPLITSILDGVGEIIPESLKTFLEGVILEQKEKVSHDLYSKKIQSIAYTIMANTL